MVALFNILSCKMSGNKFDIIESKGLDAENLGLNVTMFCNSDTGFIAGSSDIVSPNPDFPEKDSNQFAFVNRKALLFKTIDGGRNWVKKDFGEGVILDIIQTGNKIFAIKSSEDRNIVYSSSDIGQNWTEEKSFPSRISRLFSIDNGYLAITSDSSLIKTYLYLSTDFGKSWRSINSSMIVFDAVMLGNNLFFLSSNNNNTYKKNTLVELDLKDSTNKVIEIPEEFDCYFLAGYHDTVKLIGIKDGHIAMYTFQKDKQVKYDYSYMNDKNIFPQGYFKNANEDWIIVGKRGDANVTNKILKTSNNGKNWEVINFKKNEYIKPFYFYNRNGKLKAWFYAGSGEFQVLQ